MATMEPPSTRAPLSLTLAVISYNQEEFVEHAVRGALAQNYSPLEIVLSDDASSDGTFEVLKSSIEGYDGPHDVILNRNEHNLGLAGNVNRVMEIATGDIVLLAGGDDVSMPHRAARSAEVLQAEEDCLCVSFGTIHFDGSDMPTGGLTQPRMDHRRFTKMDYVATPSFHLNGASRAFRRRAFDFFGPIGADCPTEDSVMLLRCILLGDVLATPEPQVHYRVHGGNLSGSNNKYQIDRDAIHRQYVSDLELAREHGLLAGDEFERLLSTLELRLKRRNLERDLHLASNPLGVFLRSIAGSRAFRGREKLRMLGSALRLR